MGGKPKEEPSVAPPPTPNTGEVGQLEDKPQERPALVTPKKIVKPEKPEPKEKGSGVTHSTCVGRLCDALGVAETGAYQGREHGGEMRNTAGSSALTRYQILSGTSKDFRDRRPKGFTQRAKDYAEEIYSLDIPKGGAIPSHVIDHVASREHAQGVVAGMIKDRGLPAEPSKWSDDQLNTFIKRYRGVPESEDPRYYKTVRREFKSS